MDPYQLGIKLTGDAVDLKTEITSAQQALGTLESTTSDTATSMGQSFGTVAPAVNTTMTNVSGVINTSGRKLKAVGKQVGADFATSITQGVVSGDVVGSVSSVFSGLAMVGGFAALGIGLGGALITGIVKGAQKDKQEAIDAFNAMFEALEVKAQQTGEQIREEILSAFEVDETLSKIGEEFGGDANTGVDKAREAAADIGTEYTKIVELIRQGINPATMHTYQLLQDQLIANQKIKAGDEGMTEELGRQNDRLLRILELVKDRERETGKLQETAEAERDVLRDQVFQAELLQIKMDGVYKATGAYAGQLERADAAARLLMGRRLPTSDAMNGGGP